MIMEKKINHLFYMDDLKLYAQNDGELEGLLKTVKAFIDDIGMEFGLDKCAKATFKRGKLVTSENIELSDDTIIMQLDQEGTYKYLGVNEGDGVQHSKMKEKIRKECIRRVRSILKTELNSKNKLTAINTLAIPVVTYSFNVINWNLRGMIQLELSYKTSTIGLLQYLDLTNDWMLQLVRVHENSKRSHSIVKESRKFS